MENGKRGIELGGNNKRMGINEMENAELLGNIE